LAAVHRRAEHAIPRGDCAFDSELAARESHRAGRGSGSVAPVRTVDEVVAIAEVAYLTLADLIVALRASH
jgi:hypothetical protein